MLLAVAVVAVHTEALGLPNVVSGRTAVQCFFVISGFYMAMVLDRKYLRLRRRRWATFMAARVARLLPVYLLIAALSAVLVLAGGNIFLSGGSSIAELFDLPPSTAVPLILTNILVIGQDWIMFFGVNDGGQMYFTSDFRESPLPAYRLLLVPQAWTIGIELTFYAIAPWLALRSTKLLVALAVTSVTARLVFAFAFDLSADPWSYRFFPFELVFFLAGMLAYRFRSKLAIRGPRWLPLVVVLALLIGPRTHRLEGAVGIVLALLIPLAIAVFIPALFESTKRNAADRWIGELSYPLYISHILVLSFFTSYGIEAPGIVKIAVALAFTVAVVILFDRPIERWRQRAIEKRLSASGIGESGEGAGVGPGLSATRRRSP